MQPREASCIDKKSPTSAIFQRAPLNSRIRSRFAQQSVSGYCAGMRFSQDSYTTNSIRAYREGEILVNDQTISRSVVITPDTIQDWEPGSVEELTQQHFTHLRELQPEIVILGTGSQLRFPPPQLSVVLQAQGIGVEIMATDAACRTFNVLLAEDRRVLAALIIR